MVKENTVAHSYGIDLKPTITQLCPFTHLGRSSKNGYFTNDCKGAEGGFAPKRRHM